MRTLIQKGTVYDGTGSEGFAADVLVQDDKIEAVAPHIDAEVDTVIDAAGLTVAPGFIDTHRHCDTAALVDPDFGRIETAQGLTTIIGGNCGLAPLPVRPETARQISDYIEPCLGPTPDTMQMAHFSEYLDALDKTDKPLNTGSYVGIGKEAIDGINFWLKVYKNCSPAETINYTVNDHATLFYQGKTAFDFNSGFMIGGVQNNTPEIAQYVRCAPLPRMTDSDPIYSAEASHIPLVVWKNAKHPEICKAFIEYLYDTDNYVEFIHSVPVGMLPSLKDIATNSDYLNNDTIKEYSDCVDVIQTAVDEGHAIGFEHGPSAQASYLTSQGVIEEMFQDIITNGTDVETAAKTAEDKLNDIFDTMIS